MLPIKKLKAGTLIFAEGSLDKTMFLIVEGTVELFVIRHGNEVEISVLHEHEFFGEIEMFRNKPRTTSAKAITDVRLVYIKNRMQLDQFIGQTPEFSGKMIRRMGERLANANTAIL
jgi:CRP/FNR family transcriptional regulator, cyclic AMP receptor protein